MHLRGDHLKLGTSSPVTSRCHAGADRSSVQTRGQRTVGAGPLLATPPIRSPRECSSTVFGGGISDGDRPPASTTSACSAKPRRIPNCSTGCRLRFIESGWSLKGCTARFCSRTPTSKPASRNPARSKKTRKTASGMVPRPPPRSRSGSRRDPLRERATRPHTRGPVLTVKNRGYLFDHTRRKT